MSEASQPAPAGKYLVDPYEDWAKGEGVPVHGGAAVDLLTAAVKPWARFGVNGAFCHLDGRDDFLTVFLIELPPNSGSSPQQHLYEEVCYVLAGAGSTEFQAPDGHTQVIEWRPRSLFALPINAHYRHRLALPVSQINVHRRSFPWRASRAASGRRRGCSGPGGSTSRSRPLHCPSCWRRTRRPGC